MDTDTDVGRRQFSLKSLADDLYRLLVIQPVMAWQEWRCERAKAYLLTHDTSYRSSYTGNEIVRRRSRLYDEGVAPDDPRIPDRWTLESELPPMKWPHTDRFR